MGFSWRAYLGEKKGKKEGVSEWVSGEEGGEVAWWGVISSTNHKQNCILWCLGRWKATSDPILFFYTVPPTWKEVMPIAPTKFLGPHHWPHHIYSSLTQTRWGKKGWRFWNSDQCMPLKVIICPNNIFSSWRDKVINSNNGHQNSYQEKKGSYIEW